ncbi:hypothetical protein [Streptomyces buecherae]|uniref:hypothetical protein n=1 Tax=Streptomyces buecherae TaxID=2763006 RepID=UPI0036665989
MRSITWGAVLGAALLTVVVGASSPAVAEPAAQSKALTWAFMADGPGGTVRVGGGTLADPYQGGTPPPAGTRIRTHLNDQPTTPWN